MTIALRPGALWPALIARTNAARSCGALHSLATEIFYLASEDIRFIVRVMAAVVRQHRVFQQPNPEFNPFLPYDPQLFVADLSPTHLALLNKFSVVDHHLLIVTRCFESQETLLTLEDFTALAACMAEIPGLAFYNAGRLAGASQAHKHLQLIPLPLAPEGSPVPVEPILNRTHFRGPLGIVPGFAFAHHLFRLEYHSAEHLLAGYRCLCTALACTPGTPHNLLATRQWMLLVLRQRECFPLPPPAVPIPVNALAFAGALLVRDREQLKWIQTHGPLEILRSVTFPQKQSG